MWRIKILWCTSALKFVQEFIWNSPMRRGHCSHIPYFTCSIGCSSKQHRIWGFDWKHRTTMSINDVSTNERWTNFHLNQKWKLITLKQRALSLSFAYPSIEFFDRSARCWINNSCTEAREYIRIFSRHASTINRRWCWHLHVLSSPNNFVFSEFHISCALLLVRCVKCC